MHFDPAEAPCGSLCRPALDHKRWLPLPVGVAFNKSPSGHTHGRRTHCLQVGLPNVGKSSLFNALTRTQLAQASTPTQIAALL
jgi:hypothetical protein